MFREPAVLLQLGWAPAQIREGDNGGYGCPEGRQVESLGNATVCWPWRSCWWCWGHQCTRAWCQDLANQRLPLGYAWPSRRLNCGLAEVWVSSGRPWVGQPEGLEGRLSAAEHCSEFVLEWLQAADQQWIGLSQKS